MSEIEIKKVAEKTLKTADNLGIATEKAKGITLKAKEIWRKRNIILLFSVGFLKKQLGEEW